MVFKKSIQSVTGRKFTDNSFEDAKEEAADGIVDNKHDTDCSESSESASKAKDALFRAKAAEKEWSTESKEYRRDDSSSG